MRLAPGTQLGPYEILALIGEGGAGEVWTARDGRVNRVVVIKRLKTHQVALFRDEAKVIAALNHPNLCTLYDVGPDYIVMEYVEGFTLRGPMTAEKATRLAVQITSALEAAHEHGILHRDLKPSNVMVKGGSVKLLDLGLSKALAAGAGHTTTGVSGPIGIVAYMSPEQTQGMPLDERSDIFSFGALLYEMLSGHRAFTGGSASDVIRAILRDEPAPFPMSDGLARIVTRCLSKAPGDRFQRMVDVRTALEELLPHTG
jgi:serine/threonine protein kinase